MKIYTKYGKVFKILRKQKNLKLSSFTHLGISSATLSKFENGKTMLKLDKLVIALNELSISLGEYENFYNNFETILDESLIQKTNSARITGDLAKLNDLYEEAIILEEKECALAIKSLHEKPTSEEVDWLYEFFDRIKFWRTVDLYSLYLTLDFFKVRQILYLLDLFFIDNFYKKMVNSLQYKVEFVHVVCKAVFIFIFRGHKEIAIHFLDCINPSNFPHTMYTRNLYELTIGYWTAIFCDLNKGTQQMNSALSSFEKLCDLNLSKYYRYICSKYLVKR